MVTASRKFIFSSALAAFTLCLTAHASTAEGHPSIPRAPEVEPWPLVGADPEADPAEARRLRRITVGYLNHLFGPRTGDRWRMDDGATIVELLAAWVQPGDGDPLLYVAVGGRKAEGGMRIEQGRLMLLVLGFDDQGRVVERSRSPWMDEGTYASPPTVLGLIKVGVNRWAFLTTISEMGQGYGVSVYVLRAPKGPGFQRLGKIYHHDAQGNREPIWVEQLELEARPTDEQAACWPLVALRERRPMFGSDDRVMLRRERAIPCRSNGTYGVIGINFTP